ncbi:MAG: cytochrome [Pseudobdellovibrionaceae bacterium]|nr:cytochrome [Bdellovibrionales bacterium]USN47403.1 MAG: cytochrome [Pseudobdellovibrionaceae bacterium]
MYLQGNLQAVFDALYHMGVIDPVLDMDWSQVMDELPYHYEQFSQVVAVANRNLSVDELVRELNQFDEMSLSYLAIEVAKELADFHSRETLH